ncbi:MAG: hypothetical protein B9S36_07045, partial [Verrucomicrobiia bacterium Tous-C2TDCM]
MKSSAFSLMFFAWPLLAVAGDWGKAPADKVPAIEESLDLGGKISLGYVSDYLYKGYLFGGDSVTSEVVYSFEGFSTDVQLGIAYANVVSENTFPNVANDDLVLS